MGVREGRRPPACGGPTGEARGGGAERRRACGPNPAPCSDPKKQHRSQLHPFADEKRCACPAAAGRPPAAGPRAKPVAAARSAAGPAARIRPPYEPCNRPQKSRTAVTGSCPRTQQCGFPKRLCGSVLFQRLKDARGLQLGAQQPHQQVGDHHGKNSVDAAGQHLGGGGDKCRRKGAPAKAQHGDAFADV